MHVRFRHHPHLSPGVVWVEVVVVLKSAPIGAVTLHLRDLPILRETQRPHAHDRCALVQVAKLPAGRPRQVARRVVDVREDEHEHLVWERRHDARRVHRSDRARRPRAGPWCRYVATALVGPGIDVVPARIVDHLDVD